MLQFQEADKLFYMDTPRKNGSDIRLTACKKHDDDLRLSKNVIHRRELNMKYTLRAIFIVAGVGVATSAYLICYKSIDYKLLFFTPLLGSLIGLYAFNAKKVEKEMQARREYAGAIPIDPPSNAAENDEQSPYPGGPSIPPLGKTRPFYPFPSDNSKMAINYNYFAKVNMFKGPS